MKTKSTTLLNLEKSRRSLLTDDLNCCILCKKPNIDINEIYPGRNRQNSMKYGLCIPLCRFHHNQYHIDRNMQLYFMKIGQNKFEENYPNLNFINIFHKNYKD